MTEKIRVEASTRCYDVVVGDDEVFNIELARFFKKVGPARKVMVVTDTNVCPLWWPAVSNLIEKSAGCKTWFHVIKAGEESKNLDEWKKILSELAAAKFARDDLVVALGGGVVGDLAGFVASTYMRGIDWIQIPTSLLAMVDSSIGGKTGVDLGHFKNIVGSFWQPLEVCVNLKVLNTLPSKWVEDGLGEILKCSLLGSGFDSFWLLDLVKFEILQPIVKKCIELKASVVKADEHDRSGARACLNLGHTLGHALEKESRFEISHGIGVMLGLIGACKLAESEGELNPAEVEVVKIAVSKILRKSRLDSLKALVGKMSSQALAQAMLHDKKMISGDSVEIVLPTSPEKMKSVDAIPTKLISIPVADLEERFVKPALEEIAGT